MAEVLRCSQLSCGYHGAPILSDVDLRVEAGEIVCLLGPNGSGKTTLLKTIGKALPKISGEVWLQGEPLSSLSFRSAAQRCAFVPQEEVAAFPFPAEMFVAMGRICRSEGAWETPEDLAAIDRAMRQSGCEHLRGRPVTEMSGGERQRVLIARSLAQETALLILDEPTAHLDVASQVVVAKVLREVASRGVGIVVAVHDLNLAVTIGTRGVLIGGGGVVMDAGLEPVLLSQELDAAYGTNFERLRSADGTLRVHAISSP